MAVVLTAAPGSTDAARLGEIVSVSGKPGRRPGGTSWPRLTEPVATILGSMSINGANDAMPGVRGTAANAHAATAPADCSTGGLRPETPIRPGRSTAVREHVRST